MNTRKKTPKAISEQLKRIVRYLNIRDIIHNLWTHGVHDRVQQRQR